MAGMTSISGGGYTSPLQSTNSATTSAELQQLENESPEEAAQQLQSMPRSQAHALMQMLDQADPSQAQSIHQALHAMHNNDQSGGAPSQGLGITA